MSDKLRLLVALPPEGFDQFIGKALPSELEGRFDSILRVDPSVLSRDEWEKCFHDFQPHALLSGWGTPAVPSAAVPPLQFVAHAAGSIRGLVTREMIERGLLVTNWGSLAAPCVAEHALLLTLAALRRLTKWTLELHTHQPLPKGARDGGLSLFGKRVGLHGFGMIARQFIRLIQPFNCRIQAFSSGVPDEVFDQEGVRQATSLEELFANSDVVIEVEALTPATRHIVTEQLLRRMRDGAVFVNVGRGAVVDEAGLVNVAREGRLQIALDVLEAEPLPPDSPLRDLPNVTITPHIAGPTIDHRRACGRRAIDELVHFSHGLPLDGLITPGIFDRST